MKRIRLPVLLSCVAVSLAGLSTRLPASQPEPSLAALGLEATPPKAASSGSGGAAYENALAQAAEAWRDGHWVRAFTRYKQARALHPEDPRDPEVLLMIADCVERGLPWLTELVPAEMDAESKYGTRVLTWLHDTYGYTIETSEGDSIWRYDKRALAEFLRRYRHHPQADRVAYVMVTEDLLHRKYDPAVFFSRDARALACARDFIARYEEILRRYPHGNARSRIQKDLALFRGYVEHGGPLPELRWH